MAISSRPLRYDKCHLKESDAIFTKYKTATWISENEIRAPWRVVMNERSVTIYNDETLTHEVATFIIERTTLSTIADKPSCFILTS